MSFINLSIVSNGALVNHSQFHTENAMRPFLYLMQNSPYNDRISSIETLSNEVDLALNQPLINASVFNKRYTTSTLPSNLKPKTKNVFTDLKYANIPRSKRSLRHKSEHSSKNNSEHMNEIYIKLAKSFIAPRG